MHCALPIPGLNLGVNSPARGCWVLGRGVTREGQEKEQSQTLGVKCQLPGVGICISVSLKTRETRCHVLGRNPARRGSVSHLLCDPEGLKRLCCGVSPSGRVQASQKHALRVCTLSPASVLRPGSLPTTQQPHSGYARQRDSNAPHPKFSQACVLCNGQPLSWIDKGGINICLLL